MEEPGEKRLLKAEYVSDYVLRLWFEDEMDVSIYELDFRPLVVDDNPGGVFAPLKDQERSKQPRGQYALIWPNPETGAYDEHAIDMAPECVRFVCERYAKPLKVSAKGKAAAPPDNCQPGASFRGPSFLKSPPFPADTTRYQRGIASLMGPIAESHASSAHLLVLGGIAMRNWVQIALVLAGLLLLSGCGLVGPYEMRGEYMLTLDQALQRASDVYDLWALWEQAPHDDKAIIEREIFNASPKALELDLLDLDTLQALQRKASSQEMRNAAAKAVREHEQAREEEARREREEQQVQAQKHAEEIRLARKESRQRLIHEAAGKLDDKSAEQVKRLVDEWAKTPTLVDESWSDPQLFGTTDFYKAFGQPRRKQLISGHYYFYYDCRDGIVQIEVDASFLDKAGCIIVSDLNIL